MLTRRKCSRRPENKAKQNQLRIFRLFQTFSCGFVPVFPSFRVFFCFLHSLYLRPLSIVGVPKSIDNDIVFFDKTFGHALKQNSESHCVMEIYWLVVSHGTHADMCSVFIYRP